jgi:Aspartyl protease
MVLQNAVLAVVAIRACPQGTPRQVIPLEISRNFNLMLVKVEVNGQAARMVVDTGSNCTIVSSEVVGRLPSTLGNVAFSAKGSGLRSLIHRGLLAHQSDNSKKLCSHLQVLECDSRL